MEIFSKRLRELREQRRLSCVGFMNMLFVGMSAAKLFRQRKPSVSWRMSSGSPWITCGAELKNNFSKNDFKVVHDSQDTV